MLLTIYRKVKLKEMAQAFLTVEQNIADRAAKAEIEAAQEKPKERLQ